MKEEQIFHEVLEQAAEQRAAFLDAACGADIDLRKRVAVLLLAQENPGSFLQSPALDPESMPTIIQPAEQPGTQIGPYKLLEKIGEGGMGLVYMAEQQQPMRRLVALKIIKPGMDSREVIARFEAERQALAMMDHPHIAKVFEAGTTDTGRPFFVMELVRGVPINEFCDQKRLTVNERLELFMQVCQAVQHAHQKGIIHRDLKPTNVLVTLHDVLAVPKVIDFGIAKALGPQLTEHTLHTGFAQLVGTPLYMSPEQAELNAFGVDTRSDVYSLGVLLYELLTGTTPFDKDTLTKSGLDEMRRIIREDEPPRPSARVSTLAAQALSTISTHRSSDPVRISATLNGELDWIVMRALEKDRSRRYESASAFAADVQRYLSDEPVLACPPTAMYKFQKFARKHKPALVTAAAIALSLILGTTVSAWQAVRATTAEAKSNANEAQAQASAQEAKEKAQEATTQRDEAQRQRDEIRVLNDRLQRTLYAAHMNLAHSAWEAGGVGRVLELLEQYRPKAREIDLRGFEWFYLDRLCHQELLTLKGHTNRVRDVAYSPDGKFLASTSYDKTVKVWDTQTGQELLTLALKQNANSVAFSPDGKRLASPSRDTTTEAATVTVWDAQTGKELPTLMGHIGEYFYTAVFSPDGKRLAAGSGISDKAKKGYVAGEVKVWNVQTGEELLTLKGHTDMVTDVTFSPDGKRLASGSYDKAVKVWDAQSGQELLTFKGHTGELYSVAFSPDGKRLASASDDGTLKVWDAQTGQERLSLKVYADSIAFSPDGNLLAGVDGNVVKAWDPQTGQELVTFKGHTGELISVAFSPDGKQLASGSVDKTVKVWDVHAGSKPLTLKVGADTTVGSVAFSPDDKRLAAATGTWDNTEIDYVAGAVKLWDAQTGQELLTFKGHTDRVTSVAFSPDGKNMASGSGEWDSTKPGELKLWDSLTGQELLSLQGHTDRVTSVAFSPDGKLLASAGGPVGREAKGEVKVWNAKTGQKLLTFEGIGGSVAFSPDGKRLACAGKIQVKVWDVQTGAELLTCKKLPGGTYVNQVKNVTFSPDGKLLASPSGDNSVQVWDAQTAQELLALKGHTSNVTSVTFSPDGKQLASVSGDNTVKVWNAQTGDELLTLKGHSAGVKSVAFSTDGHRLVSGAADGTVKIWDATPLPEKP